MGEWIDVWARLAVRRKGKILLVAGFDVLAGGTRWVIPGERVGLGETMADAAIRGLYVHTGLRGRAGAFFGLHETIRADRGLHRLEVVFLGEIVPGPQTIEWMRWYNRRQPRWFSKDILSHLPYWPKELVDQLLAEGEE